jgi:hypothetical protein
MAAMVAEEEAVAVAVAEDDDEEGAGGMTLRYSCWCAAANELFSTSHVIRTHKG